MPTRTAPFALLLAAATASAQAPATLPLRLTLDGDMTAATPGADEPTPIKAKTVLDYTLVKMPDRTHNNVRMQVKLDQLDVEVRQGEQPPTRIHMDAGAIVGPDGVRQVVADLPAPRGQMLADSFGSPLATIVLGENHIETSRQESEKPGARQFIENGQIANALLFHPPFHADKDQWEAPGKMPLGGGSYATGTLTYAKGEAADGRVPVKVTGTLVPTGRQQGLEFQNGRYDIDGVMTWDAARNEYVAGKLTMNIAYELHAATGPAATTQGTLVATLTQQPAEAR